MIMEMKAYAGASRGGTPLMSVSGPAVRQPPLSSLAGLAGRPCCLPSDGMP
jgi:hypothetical protein